VDTTKSSAIGRTDHPETLAGDPFAYAASASSARRECPACFGGYVAVTYEEDGQERDEAVPCRRCGR
jgi:hypothetical protein